MSVGLSVYASAQSNWSDSFSDNDLTANPHWYGMTERYIHTPEGLLQLKDSASGYTYIHTPSETSYSGEWSGYLKFGFNPSSSNYAEVVLCDDTLNHSARLRIGGSSEDRITLLRRSSGNEYVLVESPADQLDFGEIDLQWKVRRDSGMQWSLSINLDSTGWITLGNKTDSILFPSHRFGLEAYYTSTRSDKIFWDDLAVDGIPYRETTSPVVTSYNWSDRRALILTLSESISTYPQSVSDQWGTVWDITALAANQFLLSSPIRSSDGTYRFDLRDFKDAGNLNAGMKEVKLKRPEYGEVIINELLFDTDPIVKWDAEYIELLNTTPRNISLEGWTLKTGPRTLTLNTLEIPGGERGLASAPTDLFSDQPAIEILPSLSLSERSSIVLLDDWGEEVYRLTYDASWHTREYKSRGGWSIERNEHLPPCERQSAWGSSTNPGGGSPLAENYPELSRPFQTILSHIELTDSGYLFVFDRPILQLRLSSDGRNAWCVPINSEHMIWFHGLINGSQCNLEGKLCSGEPFDTTGLRLAIPSEPFAGDILVSEILFDPLTDDADFLEIINISEKTVDLTALRWSKWSSDEGLSELHPVTPGHVIMTPGEIMVITKQPNEVFNTYPIHRKAAYLRPADVPPLTSEGGIAITKSNGEILDAVEWSEDDHLDYLPETKGVSLYRKQLSGEKSDLISSSALKGYATPGVIDYATSPDIPDVQMDYAQFSPNRDGFRDELILRIPDDWAGYSITFRVYTPEGEPLYTDREAIFANPGDVYRWDGKGENGHILPEGQYLILLEAIHPDRKKESWSHGCLLTNR